MNYGLYLSAAGALSSMHRQDVLANNLANMNTVGFKPDVVHVRQRLPERLESPEVFADPQLMLERLGGGHLVEPTRTSLEQAALDDTGADLDVAIHGDGMIAVSDGRGSGPEHVRLTRDGRFTLNGRGELVLAVSGHAVLDARGGSIRLEADTPIRIDGNGAIMQEGRQVARLRVVPTPAAESLVKTGDNLFRLADGHVLSDGPASGQVRQGFVESSAVDPIMTMNALMSTAKRAQSNLKMMQYADQILGQAFNTFGRVA